MPGGAEIPRGNVNLMELLQVNIAAGTVVGATTASVTVASVTVSVPGLRVGDWCQVSAPEGSWPSSSPAANLDLSNAYVNTNDVLTVQFQNSTLASITQTTALPYNVLVIRSYNYSVNQTLPSAIV